MGNYNFNYGGEWQQQQTYIGVQIFLKQSTDLSPVMSLSGAAEFKHHRLI